MDTGIVIGEMKPEVYITAAGRLEKYNKRQTLMCHKCGNKLERLICKKCKSVIKIRQHILTDFLIGAYAIHLDGQTIVTNDKGYYSSYFPELNITTVE